MKEILSYLKDKKSTLQASFNFIGDSELLRILKNEELDEKTYNFTESAALKIRFGNQYYQKLDLENAYKIINDWGGIHGFKKNEKNNDKLSKFISKLNNNQQPNLTKEEFSTISSLSKVSFFYDINRFCIYDSRVIYALNWIILKTNSTMKFFPIPSGRNKIIVDYPIDALINFLLLQQGKNLENEFYNYAEAYQKYNNLMLELTKELFDEKEKYPFFTEMLLFSMIKEELVEEIKQNIKIQIN